MVDSLHDSDISANFAFGDLWSNCNNFTKSLEANVEWTVFDGKER